MRREAPFFLLVLMFGWLSCRDVEPYYNPRNIQGYTLDGVLTSVNGIPVKGALVKLYYYYNLYSDQPVDSVQAVITDPAQILDVSVYTTNYEFLKTLYSGPAGLTGPVPHYEWDGKNWRDEPVPSGKYLIRTAIDSRIIKYCATIMDGNVTAATDKQGRFTIANENLPVGEIFDVYISSGEFYAAYEIRERIALVFIYGDSRPEFLSIDLKKDEITTGAFTL